MKKLNLQVLFLALGMLILFTSKSYSQPRPIASAGIFVTNNIIEVRVHVDSAVNTWSYISGIMFTIKCPDNAQTAFLNIANIAFISNPYGLNVASVSTNAGFKYLTFTANPTLGGTITWPANTDYQLATFRLTGGAGTTDFSLTNDNPPNFPWYFEVSPDDYTNNTTPFYHQTAQNVPLGLYADFSFPSTICAGTAVTFTNQSFDISGSTTYEFDFDGSGVTYTYNGPNTNFNAVNSVTYANTVPTEVYLRIIDGARQDTQSKVITINAVPSTPTAGNNGPVCVGDNIVLTSSTITNATYNWTGPNSFTSNIQNPVAITSTVAMVGTQVYNVTATVNGCTSAQGSTTVTILNAAPTVDAGSDISLCEGATPSLSASVSGGGTGVWTIQNGPSGVTITDLLNNTTSLTPTILTTAPAGTYDLLLTGQISGGCTTTDGMTLVIKTQPVTPTISATPSTVCEGSDVVLAVTNVISGATYTWTSPDAAALSGSTVTRTAVTAAMDGSYSVDVDLNGCTASSAATTVTVEALPTANAGANATVCQGATPNLTGSATGVSNLWTLISGPSGTVITDLLNDDTDPASAINATAPVGSYTIQLTTSSASGCSGSDQVTIIINTQPATPTISVNPASICEGADFTLTVTNVLSGATYTWTTPDAATLTGSTITRTNATPAMDGSYSVDVDLNGCTAASASSTLTVNSIPTVDAGTNLSVCAGAVSPLSGASTAATNVWTIITGPSGVVITDLLADDTDPASALLATAPVGTFSLQLTGTSASGCVASDIVSLEIKTQPATPTFTASPNPVCSGSDLTLTVTNVVSAAAYSWSTPDLATITGSTVTRTNVNASMDGNYTVDIDLNGCVASSAITAVTVETSPTVDAGANLNICQGVTGPLAGSASGTTNLWSLISGPAGALITDLLADDTDPASAISAIAPVGSYTILLTTTSANGCSASDQVTIVIKTQPATPTISATPSTVCEGSDVVLTVTNVISGATYTWTSPDAATLSGSTVTRTAVTAAMDGSYSVDVDLNGCTASSASTTVTVEALPTANAGANATVCQGATPNLTGSATGVSNQWTLISGPSGTVITDLLNDDTDPASAINATAPVGSYTIQLTTSSASGCNATDQVTIIINTQPATPTISVNPASICEGADFTLTVTNVLSGATYTWTTPDAATLTGSTITRTNATPAMDGSYSVDVDLNGCNAASASSTLTVNSIPTVDAGTNLSVCAGAVSPLSGASTAATNVWTIITGPSGVVITDLLADDTDPASALLATAPVGTFSLQLTGTSANGCIASDIVSLEIKTQPATPTFTASPNPVCSGSDLTLTVTNVVSAAAYSWSTPDLATITGSTVTRTNVNASMDGNYTVDIDLNGCVASSAITAVTVETSPTVDAGANLNICQGVTGPLAGSASGTTNLWSLISGPAGALITDLLADDTDPASAISAIAPVGSYTILLTTTSANGCSASDQVTIVIKTQPATPTISATPSTVCEGSDVVLTVTNVISGATYTWTSPDAAALSGSTVTRTAVTAAMDGSYSVDVDLNGCTASSAATTVTVETLPSANAGANATVCQGATPNLTGSATGVSNQWTLISGPSGTVITDLLNDDTDPASAINATAPVGSYTIQLTTSSASGCNATDQVTIIINTQPATPTISVNPASICEGADFTLTVTNVLSGATYTWTTPDAATLTGSTITRTNATPAMDGSYSVDVDLNGCTAASASSTLTVNSIPTVDAGTNLSVCAGAVSPLSGASTAATNVWTIITGPSGVVITDLLADDTDPASALLATAPVGTFSLQLTGTSANGCVASDIVSLEIKTQPATPTFTASPNPVCSGSDLTLTVTNVVSAAAYSWSTPDLATITGSTVTRTNVNASMDGNYTVDIDLNGCVASSAITAVTVETSPTVDAGANLNICQGVTGPLAGSASGTTNLWSLISGPAGALITDLLADDTDPASAISAIAPVGSYTILLTTTSANGCSASDQVTIVIKTQPATPTISATPSTVCEGSDVVLAVTNVISGATYTWTSPDAATLSGSTVTRTAVTAAMDGSYSVDVDLNGCTASSAATTVTVETLPSANAGANATVCQGATPNLTGSATGASNQWSIISGPAGALITDLLSDDTDPASAINATAPVGSYTILLTTSSATGCNVTDQVIIIINSQPAVPTFTATPNPVCETDDLSLNITNFVSGATYTWTTPDAVPLSGSTITRTNATPAMDGSYSVDVDLNGCTAASANTTVVVNPKPVVSAGASQAVCQNSTASLFATLNPFGTTGTWTLISGPGAATINDIISPANQSNPTAPIITSAAAGNYVLQLRGDLATCSDSDQVTITIITPSPAPIATSNSPVCVGSTLNLSITNTVSGYVYSWTGPSSYQATGSSVSLTNITAANAGDYIVNATYGTCPTVNDTITVVVNTLPTVDAGTNFVSCQGAAINVGGSGTGATFTWTLVNGPGSAVITDILTDPTDAVSSILATAPVGTYNLLLTNTTASGCSSNDQVTVEIKTQPVAPTFTALPNPACEDGNLVLSVTNVLSGATYSWVTPDLASLTGATVTRTNISASMDGGYSVDVDYNGCNASSGTTTVVIEALPTVNAGSNLTTCAGTTPALTGASTGATNAWTLISGPSGATISNLLNDITDPNSTILNTAPVGTYTIQLTGTSVSSCSASDQVTIVILPQPAVPTFTASPNPVCIGNDLTLTITNNISGATYTWTTPDVATINGSSFTRTAVTATMDGVYSVVVDLNGCSNSSANTTVTVEALPTVSAGSNLTACQGTTPALTGSSTVASNAWTLISGPSGVVITDLVSDVTDPVSTILNTAPVGTYTIKLTGTSANSCFASSQVNVEILPQPVTPTFTALPNPVCTGNDLTLTITNNVTGATYTWTTPDAATINGSSFIRTAVTSSMGGNYTVSVNLNGCTTSSAVTSVTVEALPTVSAGSNFAACQGTTPALTGSSTALTNAWILVSGPTGTSITDLVNDPTDPVSTILATAPVGTYTIQLSGTSANNCVSSDQVNVEILTQPVTPTFTTNSPICETDALTLSVTNVLTGATYTWNTPDVASVSGSYITRVPATLAMDGNYSVDVDLNGCTANSGNTAVSVSPKPVVSAGSNITTCVGSTANLSGSLSPSPGTTGVWTLISGPGATTINDIIAVADQTDPLAPLLTTAPTGTYILQLTGTLGSCTDYDQTVVNIQVASPTPIATSNSPVCEGSTLSLTLTNVVTGYIYQWYGPSGFNATGSTVTIPNVASANAGDYIVTATYGTCTSYPDTTTVVVNSLPTVDAGVVMSECQGATANIGGSGTGTSYVWTLISGPGTYTIGDLLTDATDPVSGIQATAPVGSYTIQLTAINANGCTLSDQTTVEIKTQPVAPTFAVSPNPVCSGTDLVLSVTNIVSGATYTWTTPDLAVLTGSTLTRTAVTAAMDGNYTVDIDLSGCTATSAATYVTVEASPTADAGSNLSLCQGQTGPLTGTATGVSNAWTLISGPSGAIITDLLFDQTDPASDINATAAVGTYVILLTTTSANACTASDQVIVEVKTQPVAPTFGATPNPVCEGSDLILTVTNFVSGATYTWTTPDMAVLTGSTITRTAVTSSMNGDYTVDVDLNGCTATSAITSVTVETLPTVDAGSNISVCQGQTPSLTGSGSGALFSWSLTSGPTATSISDLLTTPSSETSAINATAPIGTYVIVLTTTSANGCTNSDQIIVEIKTQPVTPTFTSNSPVCEGSTIEIVISNLVSGASYSWTTPDMLTLSGSTITRSNATTAMDGTYNVDIDLNGCTASGSGTVTINPLPVVDAGNNITVCQNTAASLNGSVSGAGTGLWTLYSGPTGSTIFDLIAPADQANLSASLLTSTAPAGNYIIMLTGTLSGCSATDIATIIINATPSVPTGSSNSPVCEGATIQLNVTSPVTGETYQWYGPNSFNATGSMVTKTNSVSADAGNYTVYASNGTCNSPVSANIAVTVNPLPTVDAGNNITACQGTSVNLSGSLSAGATATWSLVSGPSGTNIQSLIDVADLSDPAAALLTSSAPSGTYIIELTAVLSGCTVTDQATVIILSAPAQPVGSSNSPVCEGSSIILSVNSPVSGLVYEWSGPSSFASTGTTVTRANATSSYAGNYSVIASDGICSSAASTAVAVTINPLPVVDAGNNINTCQGATTNLNGTVSGGGSAQWTLVSGPSGASINSIIAVVNQTSTTPALLTSTAPDGTYLLELTGTLSGCSTSDQVTVILIPTPAQPAATSNSPVCEGSSLILSATSPISGLTYQWSGPSGFNATGTSVIRTNATSAYAGSYTVTASNGMCTSVASANVTVTIDPLPIVDAGANIIVCQGNTASLSGSVSGGGTALWSLVSGPSGTTISNIIAVADQTNATAPLATTSAPAGIYILQLTGTLTGCSASDQVTVVINATPAVPTANSNSPVCEGSTIILNVNTPISGLTYQWSGPTGFNATGTTVSRTNATSAFAGNYTVAASDGTCLSAASTAVTVTINPLPVVDAGSNITACQGATASVSGSVSGGGTAQWSLVSGPAGTNINTILNTPTSATSSIKTTPLPTAGNYLLQLTGTLAGCSASDQITVTINALPAVPTATSNSPVCSMQDIELSVVSSINGLVYEWNGPNGYHATGSTAVINNSALTDAGSYTVIASNGTCFSAPSTATVVVVNPTPEKAVASNNGPLCEYDTLNLYASSVVGVTYNWTGPNGFTSALQNPSIINAMMINAGVYYVTTTLGTCSSEPSATSVIIKPTPDPATSITGGPVCEGDQLVITALPAVAGATYHWTVPSGTIVTTSTNVYTIDAATMADKGNYTVTLSFNNGCMSKSFTASIIVNPIPAAPVVSNQITHCDGDTIFFYADQIGGAIYHWSGPNGFTSGLQNPTPFIATTSAVGVYSCYVTVNGCNSIESKTLITVDPLPPTPVLVSNGPLCYGETFNLSASNPLNGGIYKWMHPDPNNAEGNVFLTNVPQLVLTNVDMQDSGLYKVTVTGSRCTSLPATINLVVNPLPDPTITANGPIEFCDGNNVTLSAPGTPGYTYLWSNGAVSQTIVVNKDGLSKVVVTAVTGCKNYDSMYVTVWKRPIAFAGNDTSISKGFSAFLHGKGTPATLHGALIVSYLWTPPQTLDNPGKPDPIATPFVTTQYDLVVTDEHGCGDTDNVVVTVIEDYLLLPDNVITPNGDGKNDTWWIGNILTYPDNHIMIYNRYGNKVYDKKGYANEWDGGGLSNGTYYYVIIFDNNTRIYKGTITIIDKR